MDNDVRWKQRFQNYKKALDIMTNAIKLAASRELSDLEKQGVIQGFEFTFELAWNVMKNYLEEQGINDIIGSKNAIRHAYKNNLIEDGEIWMEMIKSRNTSSHTYDEETAEKLLHEIINNYYDRFLKFEKKMDLLGK
ncbi:MAG: nucleotidyltransferase substrate binding protein [Treponema sp.]|jgi:nucleotidyltransferase substrate binding protein (TIGR01987 family)|nr:nucleotidyltransferase substrate binding protein [Treponema sp.]